MTVNESFEEARRRIAVPDDVLKEAQKRRDEIRDIVEEEFDTLRTFGSGSLAHGSQNDPLNDADAGVVLDRRVSIAEWTAELPEGAPCLFPSRKRDKSAAGERRLRPITDRALGYIVSKYAALAKVEDVSPQDLRHRFGYAMAERVPLHRLAQIMGHDSLDTTMVYVKGDLQRAVEEVAWA